MNLIKKLYTIILDAIFPLSAAESELFSMTAKQAYVKLPRSPSYDYLAVKLENCHSIFAYKDERVAKLIWHIKYKKSVSAIKIGGYAIWKKIEEIIAQTNEGRSYSQTILIPIPITARRRRERGYNQCELIIDEIKMLDVANYFIVIKDLLIRIQHADRQTLKDRSHRIEDARGIFAVNDIVLEKLIQSQDKKITSSDHDQLLNEYRIIIIDDVITTGSTMKEAMNTMKISGFTNVYGLSIAH